MKFLVILSALSFIFFTKTSAQETILWSKNKLSWSDFKAAPDDSNPFYALTHTGIAYRYNANADSLHLETNTNFKPQQSWVKKPSEPLLAHEQLHFDIAEYYRRVFLDRLNKTPITIANAKQIIPEVYERTLTELRKEQTAYDEETNHSINKEAQEKWREKYQRLLIESYERKTFSVRFAK